MHHTCANAVSRVDISWNAAAVSNANHCTCIIRHQIITTIAAWADISGTWAAANPTRQARAIRGRSTGYQLVISKCTRRACLALRVCGRVTLVLYVLRSGAGCTAGAHPVAGACRRLWLIHVTCTRWHRQAACLVGPVLILCYSITCQALAIIRRGWGKRLIRAIRANSGIVNTGTQIVGDWCKCACRACSASSIRRRRRGDSLVLEGQMVSINMSIENRIHLHCLPNISLPSCKMFGPTNFGILSSHRT